MADSLEALEAQIAQLRVARRDAVRAGDQAKARQLKRELTAVEERWERLLDQESAPSGTGKLQSSAPPGPPRLSASPSERGSGAVPVREQAHQALTILGAPAGPKLISAAHQAFFNEPIMATKLGSLRRDEERSFTAQAHARPYYICPALTHDRLTPARGLLAVSTWPLEQRIVGPLGARVDFLIQAERTAEQILRIQASGRQPTDAAWRLLNQFARSIPDAADPFAEPQPERVLRAAQGEALVHQDEDTADRQQAAARARTQLSAVQQLFGAPKLGVADAPHALDG